MQEEGLIGFFLYTLDHSSVGASQEVLQPSDPHHLMRPLRGQHELGHTKRLNRNLDNSTASIDQGPVQLVTDYLQ